MSGTVCLNMLYKLYKENFSRTRQPNIKHIEKKAWYCKIAIAIFLIGSMK